MIKKRNVLVVVIVVVIAVLFLIQLDVRDGFTHGFSTNSLKYNQIYEGDIQGYVDLEKNNYRVTFRPTKDHFAGFVLYFTNQPDGNTGTIELSVSDETGKIVDTIQIELSKVRNLYDYKVLCNKELKKGEVYHLEISANGCATTPQLILVDPDYLSDECIDGNLLLGYGYRESTFTSSEKLLITILVVGAVLILIALIEKENKALKVCYVIGISCLLSGIMAWNFSFNSIDNENTTFKDFDKWSENLVITTIKADQIGCGEFITAGLNGFTDITGPWNACDKSYITDNNWNAGYGRYTPQVAIRTSEYTSMFAVVDNYIRFANQDTYRITEVYSDSTWTNITLDSERPLNPWKHGDLSEAVFLDAQCNELPRSTYFAYVSQYGLQGIVFRYLSRLFDVAFLNTLCALVTAIVFTWISYLVAKKYNFLFGSVFYLVFLLSPWTVNFADNLYWVEFTWFLPMVAGLICSLKIKEKKYRIASYFFAFVAIAVKCLCGYEYITVIMMGVILFLVVDFVVALFERDRKSARLLFRTIVIIGIVALLGFAMALCIHAPEKPGADGSILKGLKLIINNDVLRRTYGADINYYDEIIGRESYAVLASTWQVICEYFNFNTEIITGIHGNMFAFICIAPLLIFVYDFKNRQANVEMIAMYCVSFFTTMTWFVLAKSHSYVHLHLNYVLWYFGYIQVSIYIIIARIFSVARPRNTKELDI